MKNRLEQFYSAFGDRGVMFLLYAVSVVFHSLLSVPMELPAVHPDEIGVASIAAYFSGHDWSGVMGEIEFYYGYIQAILYVPLFYLFGNNPFALYKAMLVVNGIMISVIPAIAYHLASKIGIQKVWQKICIGICSGLYVTYVAHSKFIWNEAICSLLPWLLIWVTFMAWDRSNKYSRFSMSVLAGFLCAVCYGAHQRLIAVVIALVLTLIIAKVCFGESIVNAPTFVITAAVSFVTEYFFASMVKNLVWGHSVTNNTLSGELDRMNTLMQEGGIAGFLGTLSGHLYTFITSTLGFGALAAVVLFCLIWGAAKDARAAKLAVSEDGTKEYPPKRTYSPCLTIFTIYGFLSVGGSLLISAIFKLGSDKLSDVKDLIIFGRYTDNVAPIAVFVVLVFMFLYGLKLRHVLSAAALYGAVCMLFSYTGFNIVLSAETYRESPILGLLPWRIGEEITEPMTRESFIILSSVVFTMFAVMIVLISCSKNHNRQVIAVMMCGAFVYTSFFAGSVYLPMRQEDNLAKSAPAKDISALLYNDKQSPVVAAYLIPSRTAALVQFINPNISVQIIKDKRDIPDSCILITERSHSVPFEAGSYDVIGRTESYTVYAYGQGARDFVRYMANQNTPA